MSTLPGGHGGKAPEQPTEPGMPAGRAPQPWPPQQEPPQQGWPPQQQEPPQQGWPPQPPQQGWPPQQQPPQQGWPPQQQPPGPEWQRPQGWQKQPTEPNAHWQSPGQWQPAPPAPMGASPSAGFFAIALKRAFRLKILPNEVLPGEKLALEAASPPVTEPVVQAFLAWRRSLLFVVAVFLVPVTLLHAIEIFSVDTPDDPVGKEIAGTVNGLMLVNWLIAVAFTALTWVVLAKWTSWRAQRRTLLIGWAVYFMAPFLVYLYPVRMVIDDLQGVDPAAKAQAGLGVGLMVALSAMITLAPKAISIMPGLMRAAIATKLLFPGAAAPGWLMVLAAPIYALLVYVVILIPFQVSGSGLFVVAVIGLVGAQVWQARLGYRLARPVSQQEAATMINRARAGYLAFNAGGLLFIALGLWQVAEIIDWSALGIINLLLQLFVNVLLLTLIVTDIVVLSLERARGVSSDDRSREILEVYQASLHNFMASDAAFSDTLTPRQRPPS